MTSTAAVPVLVCVVGEQRYAITVADILEVAALVRYTPLPDAPPEVVGIVNRHGEAMPLLDLRRCFGLEAGPLDLTTLFVVVQAEGMTAGLIVDDVEGVTDLPPQVFSLPVNSGPYIQGMTVVAEKPLPVLEVSALLRAFAPSELPDEVEA